MNYKVGDIVLVKFPYTNLVEYKKRPVLVIKSQNEYEDIVCFQITSNPHQSNIIKIEDNFLSKKLKLNSYVKYDKCFTISFNVIDKKLSSVNEKFLYVLKNMFCNEIF
jgi:mRNA interferase MazF